MPSDGATRRATRFTGVIAVDGPAGSGKSTVSRRLAQQLGVRYLDTGAMYRAVTWAVLRAGVSPDDSAAVAEVAGRVRLEVGTDADAPRIAVDGQPVDREIRTAPVTAAVSAVSAVPEVRRLLVRQQRELIKGGAIVVEGRDIGTVVVPDAALKVFLTASAEARGGRRGAELGADGSADVALTTADLARRDEFDSARAASPLRPAADAVVLDTTRLDVPDVVSTLLGLVGQAGT